MMLAREEKRRRPTNKAKCRALQEQNCIKRIPMMMTRIVDNKKTYSSFVFKLDSSLYILHILLLSKLNVFANINLKVSFTLWNQPVDENVNNLFLYHIIICNCRIQTIYNFFNSRISSKWSGAGIPTESLCLLEWFVMVFKNTTKILRCITYLEIVFNKYIYHTNWYL